MEELFEKQQYATTNRQYEEYALNYSMPDDPLMAELVRKTHLSYTTAGMLSGHLQGQFLSMICSMLQAHLVIEIGTYTGYSAIYMARGLPQDGILHTIDNNPETEEIATEFINRAGLNEKIVTWQGDAAEILSSKLIPLLNKPVDLVFIDADKENYIKYYELCLPLLRPGGFIIADNVLWYGRVINPGQHNDKETLGIIAFNNHVLNDTRVEQVLLPVRDGLMLVKVKGN